MKQSAFLLIGVLGIALTACTAANSNPTPEDGVPSDSMSSSPDIDTDTSSSSSDESAMEGEARVIEMTASNWEFSPKSISIKKGEKVIVRVTGGEGIHSFGVKDLGINVTLQPGETKDIEIPSDTAGTFAFRCMVPCGEGHKEMTGTLTITA